MTIGAVTVAAFSLFVFIWSSTQHQVRLLRDSHDTRQAGELVDTVSDAEGGKMFHIDMEWQRLHLPMSERLSLKHAIHQAALTERGRVQASDYTSPFNSAALDQNIPGRPENEKKQYEVLDQRIHQQLQKDERLHLSSSELDRRVDAMNKAGEAEISRGGMSQ